LRSAAAEMFMEESRLLSRSHATCKTLIAPSIILLPVSINDFLVHTHRKESALANSPGAVDFVGIESMAPPELPHNQNKLLSMDAMTF
jgi:hypothetical protein